VVQRGTGGGKRGEGGGRRGKAQGVGCGPRGIIIATGALYNRCPLIGWPIRGRSASNYGCDPDGPRPARGWPVAVVAAATPPPGALVPEPRHAEGHVIIPGEPITPVVATLAPSSNGTPALPSPPTQSPRCSKDQLESAAALYTTASRGRQPCCPGPVVFSAPARHRLAGRPARSRQPRIPAHRPASRRALDDTTRRARVPETSRPGSFASGDVRQRVQSKAGATAIGKLDGGAAVFERLQATGSALADSARADGPGRIADPAMRPRPVSRQRVHPRSLELRSSHHVSRRSDSRLAPCVLCGREQCRFRLASASFPSALS